MSRDFTIRKQTIIAGVLFLVLADVALAAYSCGSLQRRIPRGNNCPWR